MAENLAIKTDCLDDFDNIPFRVRSGTVRKLTVLWRKEQSVALHVDTVSVVLESSTDNALTPEQKLRAEKLAKQQLLEQWVRAAAPRCSRAALPLTGLIAWQESRLDENLAPHQSDANSQAKDDEGGNAGAYRAILDRLEVTISRIDFTYYDQSGTLGAHIDTIALENHKPTEPSDLLEHTIKSAKLSGFALFVRSAGDGTDGATAETSSRQAACPNYILHPCTASVRIGYDTPKAKFDLGRPRISVVAEVPELAMLLRREQLLCVVKVADLFDDKRRERLSRAGRPAAVISLDPGAWWRYAQKIVLEDVRERRRRRSAAFLLDRHRRRKRYVDLYLRHRAGKAQMGEAKEMEGIEEDLGFHEIVFFRCTAIRQLQERCGGELARREQTSAKKSAWSFAGWSWKGGKEGREESSKHGDGAASSRSLEAPLAPAVEGEGGELGGNASNPFHGMTPEEREALFSAMAGGGSDLGVTYTSLMQSKNPEQHLYTLAVSLGSCSARFVDPGRLDFSASFNDATVKVKGRVQAMTWQVCVEGGVFVSSVDWKRVASKRIGVSGDS